MVKTLESDLEKQHVLVRKLENDLQRSQNERKIADGLVVELKEKYEEFSRFTSDYKVEFEQLTERFDSFDVATKGIPDYMLKQHASQL